MTNESVISALKSSETAMLRLRALYESRGYLHFKMSRFEEYDIYAKNKDFLSGENIITFTDNNGRLMALKPDVTMSIIRNSKDIGGITERYHYSENVYRAFAGQRQLTGILQSGLECIGDIDLYCTCEVIGLAAQGLGLFEREYVLDISHMGIVSGLIDELNLPEADKKELLGCIAAKNTHGIKELLGGKGEKLTRLLEISTNPAEAVSELKKMYGDSPSDSLKQGLNELSKILDVLQGEEFYKAIRLDFSVVQDISYYNGVVFQGFIMGIPEKILTGGRYDLLMRRMGKQSGAIGFGININLLERIFDNADEFDADVAILYNDESDVKALRSAVQKLIESGSRVAVVRKLSEKAKYRSVKIFKDGGLCDAGKK